MRIAREGIPFLLAAVVPFVGTAIVGQVGDSLLWKLVALTFGAASAFIAYFFRDPQRSTTAADHVLVSAADGRIVEIADADEPFLGGPCLRISTFLSIFNVHVQRAPGSARVEHRQYDPGKYLAAWEPKASELNERAALGFQSGEDRFLVRQIAGLVARRIVTDPLEGDHVERCDRIGLIRFGSRVDLFVPRQWEVLCQVGDRVRAGQTPLVARPVSAEPPSTSPPS